MLTPYLGEAGCLQCLFELELGQPGVTSPVHWLKALPQS